MAGLSFLYAFFNLYSTGGGPGVPTLEEAMLDIESCMAVLEYLARKPSSALLSLISSPPARVPSAGACHDTMRNLSQAIMEQLSKRPVAPTSPRMRPPVSSSRDDPLPNESFPTPLPAVTLPYELSLLDNLFFNPMAAHTKASDYTVGPNKSKRVKEIKAEPFAAPPQGFPPTVFQSYTNPSPLGAYGVAAQVGSTPAGDVTGGLPLPSGDGATGVQDGFDIFSFLMDEEGGLGGSAGAWETMEVPPDYSLWS